MIDLHETIEGRQKAYPRTAKFDLRKLVETMKETLERELPKMLEEIDIDDSRYENVEVITCPRKETMKKEIEPTKMKKGKITINESKFYDIFSAVRMKDLRNYDFQVAFWEKEGEQYALYPIRGKYFIVKVDDFTKLFDKISGSLEFRKE